MKQKRMSNDTTSSLERGARLYDMNRNRYDSDSQAYAVISGHVGLEPEKLRVYCEKTKAGAEELIELTIEVLEGYQFALDTWYPYLEPETSLFQEKQKDLAFAILMGCVSDWCQTLNSSTSKGIYQKIEVLNATAARVSVSTIFAVNIFAAEFMERFSPKEQVFLRIARDRIVHGFLTGYVKDSRCFKIINPIISQNQTFEEQSWTRNDQRQAVQEIGNGDIWEGVRNLRKKFARHLDLLCLYLKPVRDLPPEDIRRAFSNGHYIVDPDLENNYQAFKAELDLL
jgi:hypothetical protein